MNIRQIYQLKWEETDEFVVDAEDPHALDGDVGGNAVTFVVDSVIV